MKAGPDGRVRGVRGRPTALGNPTNDRWPEVESTVEMPIGTRGVRVTPAGVVEGGPRAGVGRTQNIVPEDRTPVVVHACYPPDEFGVRTVVLHVGSA